MSICAAKTTIGRSEYGGLRERSRETCSDWRWRTPTILRCFARYPLSLMDWIESDVRHERRPSGPPTTSGGDFRNPDGERDPAIYVLTRFDLND